MDDEVIELAREIYVHAIADRLTNMSPDLMKETAKDALQAAEAFFAVLAKH